MKEANFVLLYATRLTTSKRASEQQHTSTEVCAYWRRLLLVGVRLVVSLSGIRLRSALFLCLEVSTDFIFYAIIYH